MPPPTPSSQPQPPPPPRPPILKPLNPTDLTSSTLYLPLQNRHIGYSIHGVPLPSSPSSSPPGETTTTETATEETEEDETKTIFILHGTPGSRLNAHLFTPLANDLKIRVIGLDRPGYGLSTPLPDSSPATPRFLRDYALTDLLPLADHLGIRSFHVVGISGGGPWAAGVACSLSSSSSPSSRLKGTGILVGMAPTDTGSGRLGLTWGKWLMWRSAGFFGFMKERVKWGWWDGKVEDVIRRLYTGGGGGGEEEGVVVVDEEEEKKMMDLTEKVWDNEFGDGGIFRREEEGVTVRERMRMSLREQGHQGGKGFEMDVLCGVGGGRGDWGFDWEAARRVRLWYAGRDNEQTPVEMGRWYYDMMMMRKKQNDEEEKDVVLKVCEEETHFSLVVGDRHIREIFEDLLAMG